MSRLPQVNSDKGNWGKILNTWLKHIAGYRGVAPARPASGSLPAGVAINGTGYDTTDQYQSENSGLNFHNDFPANVSDGFTFIHTVHNRIYRREGNDWAVLLEGYTPQSGEHLWRRVATGSPNIRNVPVDGFVGINTDPDYRLHVLENRNDTIALFEGGSNNDIAEVKIFNSNVRSRSRPGGGTIVGGDALLTFETTNNAVWSVGITADYNNDGQRDNFFVISVNNRFGPHSQNDPADDYLIITPPNKGGAVGIGNNYVPNTNLPPSATLPNDGFYKLDVQGNANVWEQTTTRNFRMWDQNPQVNSLLTSVDTQGNAVWRDFVTLGLVTNAENIPINNTPATDHGWSFAQKVGTVLQFRKITAENQNHGTLFRVRTDGDLIRIGLTGGNNGDIIWRNRNTGVYEWTNPSSIRDALGLGTLTVGPSAASAGVIQVNPNSFNPAQTGNQNINIGFTGGSNGQFLTVNNGTYQWASAQTLNLVTNAENIPQSAVNDPNNHGLSYFGKNGTILQFRAIQGENLIRARTDNQLIRVGLTGGQGNQPQMIVYNFNNSGTYTWQNIPNIRSLLGLGTLTVGPLSSSAGVIQVSPNSFDPATSGNQNINIGFTGGSNGQFLTVNNGTYQWASFGTLTLNNTSPNVLAISNPNTYDPTNNRTINIGLSGGSNGQIIWRNPNTGVYEWTNTSNIADRDWLVAQNNGGTGGTGAYNQVPSNIDQWIYTNGRVGIGTSNPKGKLHVSTLQPNVTGVAPGAIVMDWGGNQSNPSQPMIQFEYPAIPNVTDGNSHININRTPRFLNCFAVTQYNTTNLSAWNVHERTSFMSIYYPADSINGAPAPLTVGEILPNSLKPITGTYANDSAVGLSAIFTGRVGIGTNSPRSQAQVPNISESFGPVRLEVKDGILVPYSTNSAYFAYLNQGGISMVYLNEDNYKSSGQFITGNYTTRILSSHSVAIFMAYGFRRPGEGGISLPPDANPAIIDYSRLNDNGTLYEPTTIPTNFEIFVNSYDRGDNPFFNNRPVKRIFVITDSGDVWIGGVNTGDPNPNNRLGGRLSVTRQLRIGEVPQVNSATTVLTRDTNGWIREVPVSSLVNTNNFWSLTGNSGTNPANNFLGTTDNQPLVFRTNSSERVRIDTNGRVGIGTNSPTANLHTVGSVRFESLPGSGPHLTIDANGNLSRTTISSGSGSSGDYDWYLAGTNNVPSNAGDINNKIWRNGAIGIGTNNPVATIDLSPGGSGGKVRIDANVSQPNGGVSQYVRGYVFSNIAFDGTNWITSNLPNANFNDFSGMYFANGGSLRFVAGQKPTNETNLGNDLATYTRMTIFSNGNVGIGVANPLAKLHIVHNSIPTSPQLRLQEVESDFARLQFDSAGGDTFWHIAARSNDAPLARMNFYQSGRGDLLTILKDGRVLIPGVPDSALEVTNTSRGHLLFRHTLLVNAPADGHGLNSVTHMGVNQIFQEAIRGSVYDYVPTAASQANNSNISFSATGILGMSRITDVYSDRLHTSAAVSAVLYPEQEPTPNYIPGTSCWVHLAAQLGGAVDNVDINNIGVPVYLQGNTVNAFFCRTRDDLTPNENRVNFINCSSVNSPNDNNGNPPPARAHFVVSSRGIMYLWANDNTRNPSSARAFKNGTSGTWELVSDGRLKTNIRPITNALAKIKALRGVEYEWINKQAHAGDATSGFIAQEMEKVFPECVAETAAFTEEDSQIVKGPVKTVGLSLGFHATVVEAIKEQQQMIEELQKTVAQQQQLIDLQNQKITQLEQKLEELANKLGS